MQRLAQVVGPTRKDLDRIRVDVCKELGVSALPGNADLIRALRPEEAWLKPLLTRKRTRTASGVCVIAVMTKPLPCPLPQPCAYCPGGPSVGMPQSYTGREPASLRGLQYGFDPYLQVRSRIEQLQAIGHTVDKVELILMGGTFTSHPLNYREWFVQRCLDAICKRDSHSLEEAKRNSEAAPIRNSGITIETRPDRCNEADVNEMLRMGVTRVELGVQTLQDEVYALVGRGHTVDDVVEATRVAKDSGLKVTYHMMPNLPGSTPQQDLDTFRTLFADPRFQPDALKIYPCLVIKGTRLYDWWQRGLYRAYTERELLNLLVEASRMIPPYVRVQRLNRDIPVPLIEAGPRRGDLRELVEKALSETGYPCRCIRCREAGHVERRRGVMPLRDKVRLVRREYDASGGREFFLSYEDLDADILVAYARLRKPSEKAHRPELADAAVLRELHVCGPMLPVGAKPSAEWQHRGYGRLLLTEAERITREELGLKKLAVISGLGVKGYYRRLSYVDDGPYMSRSLSSATAEGSAQSSSSATALIHEESRPLILSGRPM
ncbi:MAG: tRNA uridine(34) 5-carboxymethylaminomethyl modification radical SAM/GNAT enzyme Elp3 [Candidatus Bathyarchaeia archaeon]